MMKRAIQVTLGVLCLLGLSFSARAQYYTGVLEVFYQSIAYPESFDHYVASNPPLFDSRFFSCLASLEQFWTSQARQEEQICNGHLNPEWRRKCTEEAVYIKLPGWSANLRSVLAGQQQWPNTIHGEAAILGKRLAGADLWVQSVNAAFQNEMHRRIYLCESTSANPEEVSKDEWVDSMFTHLPPLLCQPDQYFRQCFDVSNTQCEKTATSATRACLQKYKGEIPNTLKQPKDGTYWGRILGSCVSDVYEKTLMEKRISNKRCNDPTSWR
jgi:hypothetical protein